MYIVNHVKMGKWKVEHNENVYTNESEFMNKNEY